MILVAVDPGTKGTGVAWYDSDTCEFGSMYFESNLDKMIGDTLTLLRSIAYNYKESKFFVEDGNHQHVKNNKDMTKFCDALKVAGAELVRNAGVKTVITDALMKDLDLWDEPTKTHHKDIRSARRLLLYIIGKDYKEQFNKVINKKGVRND